MFCRIHIVMTWAFVMKREQSTRDQWDEGRWEELLRKYVRKWESEE
jgi:hypothetical protein